jgi:hypothetical protein
MTFIIQGNSPTAIPPQSGGGLGYGPDHVGGTGGIPNSIAIKFDTFNNQGEGNNSTGLFVDGHAPTIPTDSRDTLVELNPNIINLTSGHPFLVHLTYDGTTLTETITDTITNGTFTTSYVVNIPGDVGGNVGYVGFGAGTGGNTALQDISAWIYTTPDPGGVASARAIAGAASAAAVSAGAAPLTGQATLTFAAPANTQGLTTNRPSSTSGATAGSVTRPGQATNGRRSVVPQAPSSTAAVDAFLEHYAGTPKPRRGSSKGLIPTS